MSAVTRERVEEMIEQQRDEFENNKYQAEHWQRGPRDLLAALTRLLALEDALKEAGPFIVKHYTADGRPIIKGNGFDGLEIGEDREEAQEFVDWINARITALAALGGGK